MTATLLFILKLWTLLNFVLHKKFLLLRPTSSTKLFFLKLEHGSISYLSTLDIKCPFLQYFCHVRKHVQLQGMCYLFWKQKETKYQWRKEIQLLILDFTRNFGSKPVTFTIHQCWSITKVIFMIIIFITYFHLEYNIF